MTVAKSVVVAYEAIGRAGGESQGVSGEGRWTGSGGMKAEVLNRPEALE